MEWLFEDFVQVFQRIMGICPNFVSIPEKVGNILFWLRMTAKKKKRSSKNSKLNFKERMVV